MQAMKWQRENLEALVKDLLEENKRLTRINFGRVVAVVFFTFWAVIAWNYLTSPNPNTKSCKPSQQANTLKK